MSESKSWFSDETFWQAYASVLFDGDHWGEVPEVVDSILKLSNTKSGGSVLDLCCGPGRHSLEFGQRGFAVTGVDISPSYLEAAKDSASSMELDIDFVEGDARYWSRPHSFDLAVNLFTSFGYFDTREEDLELLKRCYENLKDNGVLVMEFISKEVEARNFIPGEWFERDGRLIMTEFTISEDWEYLVNRWIVIENGKKVDKTWRQRLYSSYELKTALLNVGFSKVKFYGSYDGSPYDENAQRLVAVANK